MFLWDLSISRRYSNTWNNNIKSIFNTCELVNLYNSGNSDRLSTKFIVDTVRNQLQENFKNRWSVDVNNMSKLRTFKLVKSAFQTEPYIKMCLSRKQRSVIARMRCGTFPLEVEKGRYRNVPANQRICKMCNSNAIEDETHFLLFCERYSDVRANLFRELSSHHDVVINVNSPVDALKELLTHNCKTVANFILDCSLIKQNTL